MSKKIATTIMIVAVVCYGAYMWLGENDILPTEATVENVSDLGEIPEYNGSPYVEVNGNKVDHKGESTETYIKLSELDSLGRCGVAEAVVGKETLPTEKRGSIGMVRPSGWPEKVGNAKYDFVDGKYLWNRAHLLAFSLTGINADERNLITGTRSMNAKYMWQFEEEVLDYINSTGNHVFYRVTPIFEGENLVASGVHMEAKSIEDNDIEFSVYVFNVEPGVVINYADGSNHAE